MLHLSKLHVHFILHMYLNVTSFKATCTFYITHVFKCYIFQSYMYILYYTCIKMLHLSKLHVHFILHMYLNVTSFKATCTFYITHVFKCYIFQSYMYILYYTCI